MWFLSIWSDGLFFPAVLDLLGAAPKSLEKAYSFLLNLFRCNKTNFKFEHQEFLLHFKIAKSHELSLKWTIHINVSYLKMWIPGRYFILIILNKYCISWLHASWKDIQKNKRWSFPLIFHWEKACIYFEKKGGGDPSHAERKREKLEKKVSQRQNIDRKEYASR